MGELRTAEHLNEDEQEALQLWHRWAFDEGVDKGLIVEMCQIRDKYAEGSI